MNVLKRIFKFSLYFLAVPISYILLSLLLTFITIGDKAEETTSKNKTIYLSTNGVHLDIVIAKKDINTTLLKSLAHHETAQYFAFGWGDENFYINTPTWDDLTFSNAFQALFLRSSTLMHVTRYRYKSNAWVEVKLSETQLEALTKYIFKSFKIDDKGNKIEIPNAGYSSVDNFYKANGSYSCFYTCNTWVNTAFKQSDLKAALWTPFDFGLMGKYQ